MGKKVRVLITVKTYPQPHEKYKELVCTAGVREDGSFIRLHPINFRYRPYWQWYEKYQWIEFEVEKNKEDRRPESFRPVEGNEIKLLGERLSTKNNWAGRKEFVLAKGVQTMCDLQTTDQFERSLGIIRPAEVRNFLVEETNREWKPEHQALFDQLHLFGEGMKPLEKIPYKFSYKFLCESPDCLGHTKMITDWEVGALYLKMRDKYCSEDIAVEKVKQKFFGEICAQDKDTHFFVGTVNPKHYKAWIIIGTFYPAKEEPKLPF